MRLSCRFGFRAFLSNAFLRDGLEPIANRGTALVLSRYIFLALVFSGGSVFASEYQVEGEIVQTLFDYDGRADLTTRSKFTVYVKGCAWLIQTIDLDQSGLPLIARETGSTNETEIREVEGRWRDEAGKLRVGTNQPSGFAWDVATIVSNRLPVGQTDDYFVCHLWFMYASGCLFESLNTNWLTPVYDVNASVTVNPGLKQEAKFDVINGVVPLPLDVIFFKRRNAISATYHATGVTKIDTLKIPNGFVFEQRVGARFAPGPIAEGENHPSYRIRKRAVASVTRLLPTCLRQQMVPAAKGRTVEKGSVPDL